MEQHTVQLATKVKKYIESKIIIEPREKVPYWYWRDLSKEEQIKQEILWYRNWAKEIMEFYRDHRSQDINDCYVDVTEIDACSKCGESWGTYIEEETGNTLCASCGTLIKIKEN